MIPRRATLDVETALRNYPVVALIGARQTGKTTLAKAIAEKWPERMVYLDLELPTDLAKLDQPESYLRRQAHATVIFDEIQNKPELFPLLRALADAIGGNGRYFVLGSASGDLLRQSSESLAGRISYHELTPLALGEVAPNMEDVFRLWCRGGFPRSFLAPDDAQSLQWRDDFVRTYLARDIAGFGLRVSPTTFRRCWTMIAHCHGQLWNASKIAGSLGVDASTVAHYLDVLEETFMVRRLQPFFGNRKKRLVKSPKVFLRDSGLLHALLGIGNEEALLGHPAAGLSWEGWVMEQILAIVPRFWDRCFYRTAAGAEIDLVLLRGEHRPAIAVEMKYSEVPRPSRGFWSGLADLQPARGFVIYPGDEYYPLKQGVFALPVTQLERLVSLEETG